MRNFIFFPLAIASFLLCNVFFSFSFFQIHKWQLNYWPVGCNWITVLSLEKNSTFESDWKHEWRTPWQVQPNKCTFNAFVVMLWYLWNRVKNNRQLLLKNNDAKTQKHSPTHTPTVEYIYFNPFDGFSVLLWVFLCRFSPFFFLIFFCLFFFEFFFLC